MKKLIIICLVASLSLAVNATESKSSIDVTPISKDQLKPEASENVDNLLLRLDEINALDKSNLTAPEKRKLRNELKKINSELINDGGGLYISIGGALLIVLLVILLL